MRKGTKKKQVQFPKLQPFLEMVLEEYGEAPCKGEAEHLR
jgi:hypothetical protein